MQASIACNEIRGKHQHVNQILLHDVTRHASFRTLYVDVKICCIQIAEAPPTIKNIIINKNGGIEPSLLVCVRRTSEIIQNIFVEYKKLEIDQQYFVSIKNPYSFIILF